MFTGSSWRELNRVNLRDLRSNRKMSASGVIRDLRVKRLMSSICSPRSIRRWSKKIEHINKER